MKILIVEDEKYLRNHLIYELEKYGEVTATDGLVSAKNFLLEDNFDVAFIDLNLTDSDNFEGLELVKACQKVKTVPIVLTSHASKEVIAAAYNQGCHHYFTKQDFQENLHSLVGGILKALGDTTLEDFFSFKYITKNESLKNSISYLLQEFQNSDRPVLITGGTGVGKTKIAKLLHEKSMPKTPFIHLNLSEISEALLESELFGHKKGAFTGASTDKVGYLEKANGGILFLDEIGAIPLSVQRKLLRVIEEKSFSPVGSTKKVKSNFRLITATCDNLQELLGEGKFRIDFYFRIKGLELNIPSLVERVDDIIPLVDFFISKSPKKVSLSTEAETALKNYSWFGNIRELENTTKELIGKSRGLIGFEQLPAHIQENKAPFFNSPKEEGWLTPHMKEFVFENGLSSLLEEIEVEILKEAQSRCGGRTNEVVRQLKISKSLYYRIAKNLEAKV